MPWATIRRTSPAPERAAAVEQRNAAPVNPRLPATASTVPKVPLCASGGRWGRRTASGAGSGSSAPSGISRIALAIARPAAWVMLTCTWADLASPPSSRTSGAPPLAASTSIRRRGKQIGVPLKHLITASLAAHRPASLSGRPAQYASSASVNTRRRKRSPDRRTATSIRSTPQVSTPIRRITPRTLQKGEAHVGATRARHASPLLHGDGLGQVPGLVDVRPQVGRHVVGEQLKRNRGQHRG